MLGRKDTIIRDKRILYAVIVVFIGAFLRFLIMTYGYTFDFESYKIVGNIMSKSQSVYAMTTRYNYGPVFFYILGLCQKIASHVSIDPDLTYRTLIVGVLTLTDIAIALWLCCHYGIKAATLFFLNPISIIITGYHNQFDNIAILFILLSVDYYNDDKIFTKHDLLFIILFTISLIVKHDLYAFPIWLLFKKGLPILKKLLYAFIPPFLFLLSFVPFYMSSPETASGIKNNVFFYRSSNNAPLLNRFYTLLGIDNSMWFICFIVIMILAGILAGKLDIQENVLIYLICLVTFSSAVTNQYLAIPLVSLCSIGSVIILFVYSILMTLYLLAASNEFGMLSLSMFDHCQEMYLIATILLLITLLYIFIKRRRGQK